MALGSCDNCDRKNVSVANHETPHGDTTQCYICTACPWEKDPDPDPYGELDCEQCYGSGFLTTDESCERECAYCGGTGVAVTADNTSSERVSEMAKVEHEPRRKLSITTRRAAA